jgi:hypothetical protein
VTVDESNGLFSVKTVYSLVLSRQELGAYIECRVESPALSSVVSNQILLDLQGEYATAEMREIMCFSCLFLFTFFSSSNKNSIVRCKTSHSSRNQSFAAMYGMCYEI